MGNRLKVKQARRKVVKQEWERREEQRMSECYLMNSMKYEQYGSSNRVRNTKEKEIMEGMMNGKTGRKRDNQQILTKRKGRPQQGRTKVTEKQRKEKVT